MVYPHSLKFAVRMAIDLRKSHRRVKLDDFFNRVWHFSGKSATIRGPDPSLHSESGSESVFSRCTSELMDSIDDFETSQERVTHLRSPKLADPENPNGSFTKIAPVVNFTGLVKQAPLMGSLEKIPRKLSRRATTFYGKPVDKLQELMSLIHRKEARKKESRRIPTIMSPMRSAFRTRSTGRRKSVLAKAPPLDTKLEQFKIRFPLFYQTVKLAYKTRHFFEEQRKENMLNFYNQFSSSSVSDGETYFHVHRFITVIRQQAPNVTVHEFDEEKLWGNFIMYRHTDILRAVDSYRKHLKRSKFIMSTAEGRGNASKLGNFSM